MLTNAVDLTMLRFLRSVHYSALLLLYGILGSIECICFAAILGVLQLPHGVREWALAVGFILLILLYEIFLMQALKLDQASPVSFFLILG